MLVSSEITARIKAAQGKDEMLKAIMEILTSCPYEGYKMKAGLVYKEVKGNDLLVIPKAMEKEVIVDAHSAGNFALQKTVHAVQQLYWIPLLEQNVQQVVNNCVRCIIFNKKLGKKEGFLSCIDNGDQPLHAAC